MPLSKVERQQLCCMCVVPQAPPICLQQARSAAFIWADGMAHAIVGASRHSTSKMLLILRLGRSIKIQHIEHRSLGQRHAPGMDGVLELLEIGLRLRSVC